MELPAEIRRVRRLTKRSWLRCPVCVLAALIGTLAVGFAQQQFRWHPGRIVRTDNPRSGVSRVLVIAGAASERTGGSECPEFGAELNRTMTDNDGYFTLEIDAGTTVFSVIHCGRSVGYTTRTTVTNPNRGDGMLEQNFIRLSPVIR